MRGVLERAAEQVHACAWHAAESADSRLERWAWQRRADLLPKFLLSEQERLEELALIGSAYNHRGLGVGCIAAIELEDWHQMALRYGLDPGSFLRAEGHNSCKRGSVYRFCAERMAHDTALLQLQGAYGSLWMTRATANEADDVTGVWDAARIPCGATCMPMMEQSPLMDDFSIIVRVSHDGKVLLVDNRRSLWEFIQKRRADIA